MKKKMRRNRGKQRTLLDELRDVVKFNKRYHLGLALNMVKTFQNQFRDSWSVNNEEWRKEMWETNTLNVNVTKIEDKVELCNT